MSAAAPLLAQTIEPDDPSAQSLPTGRIGEVTGTPREPVVLTPTNAAPRSDSTPDDVEAGTSAAIRFEIPR